MLNIKREAIVIDPTYLYTKEEQSQLVVWGLSPTDAKVIKDMKGIDVLAVNAFWGEGVYRAGAIINEQVVVQEYCVDSGVYVVFDADDFEAVNPGVLDGVNEQNYARMQVSGEVIALGSKLDGVLKAGTRAE